MTCYTKLRIIHVGTDVHIRVRGTREKHLSELLTRCISVLESSGALNVYLRSNNNNDKDFI